MAKKSSIAKQKRREKLVDQYAAKRAALKKVIYSLEATPEEKEEAMFKLTKMKKNGSAVRLRNRCLLTGRPRGYLRKFGLSRLCFREMSLKGMVPGITKSSW